MARVSERDIQSGCVSPGYQAEEGFSGTVYLFLGVPERVYLFLEFPFLGGG